MQHTSPKSALLLCCALGIGLLSALGAGSHAAAQAGARAERPAGAILRSNVGDGIEESLGGAVDRIVRSRLDALGVVEIRGSVALDLSDVQLALGCVGETEPCLRAVAEELGVRVLLLPSLTRAGSETIVSLSLFENGGDPALRSVSRRIVGEEGQSAVLDSVEGQLRELFDLPPVAEHEGGGQEQGPGPELPPDEGPSLVGPLVLAGVGVALIGVGLGLGLASADALDAYRNHAVGTMAEVDQALGLYGQAEGLAIGADLLFVVGGAAALGGVIWLIAELSSGGSSGEGTQEPAPAEVSLFPAIGPNQLGLQLAGTLPEVL